MEPEEAENLLRGEESLEDRLKMLAGTSPEIANLAVEIPRAEWEQHLGRELSIPADQLEEASGRTALTREDVALIEEAVERAHGITAPFGAMLEIPTAGGPAVAVLVHDEKGWCP